MPQIEFVLKAYEGGQKPNRLPEMRGEWVSSTWGKHMAALVAMDKGKAGQVTSILSRVLLKRARYVLLRFYVCYLLTCYSRNQAGLNVAKNEVAHGLSQAILDAGAAELAALKAELEE